MRLFWRRSCDSPSTRDPATPPGCAWLTTSACLPLQVQTHGRPRRRPTHGCAFSLSLNSRTLSRKPCRPAGPDPRTKPSEHTCSPPSTQQWYAVYHCVASRLPHFQSFAKGICFSSVPGRGEALPGDMNHPVPGAGWLGLRRAATWARQEPEHSARLQTVKALIAPASHTDRTQCLVL